MLSIYKYLEDNKEYIEVSNIVHDGMFSLLIKTIGIVEPESKTSYTHYELASNKWANLLVELPYFTKLYSCHIELCYCHVIEGLHAIPIKIGGIKDSDLPSQILLPVINHSNHVKTISDKTRIVKASFMPMLV